jgi:hypothetical protein
MKRRKYTGGLIWGSMLFPVLSFSQVTIKGPSCVLAGTTYHYLIGGPAAPAGTMQIRLTGGTITDSAKPGRSNGAPLGCLSIVWKQGASANLQVSTPDGNASLPVTLTSVLAGGTIDTSVRVQLLAAAAIPKPILCSAASGGSCSPSYQYQWQQSTNLLDWTDITQATGIHLLPSQALGRSCYFRRKVTEIHSGTIAYSDAAYVEVAPIPHPGSSDSTVKTF